ncbi:MAG: glycosyltransferase [Candidatus Omnitrophota bacterium]|nr:glycosyltransferase [Candidatus Omnitrophota bacterium]
MNRFNILYVENFGDIIGGGQISLLNLLERLDKEKFEPIVVCPTEGSLVKRLKELNIEVKIIQMKSLKRFNISSFIKSVLGLRKLIRDRNIDLIHANGSRACLYAGIAAKKKNVPLIWHVRVADSDALLDRFLAKLSTKIIAISNAVNNRFSWMKNREARVITIYNGIDLRKFNPSLTKSNIREELNFVQETPLVGTVGRLDWYKGHKYLLKAARIVVDNIPECHFLIVGEGEKRKKLESLTSQLKLNNNVIFTGYRDDIPEILASLDLFVLPSVSEGLGRSIVEAMAMERSVVATNVGGIPEVVQDKLTGILVLRKDTKAMANAIIDLLISKDKANKMGLVGRKRAEVMFDLDTNVKKIQQVYIGLLN